MKTRLILAALTIATAIAGRVAAQERFAEEMVRSANAAYIEALTQHQRLLSKHDPKGLPAEGVAVLVDATDRVLWAAAAMANMCASARAMAPVLTETRCAQVDADLVMLEQQRAELRALLDARP